MTFAVTSTRQQNLVMTLQIFIIINHLSLSNSQSPPSDNLEVENKRHCDKDFCDSLVSKCVLTERCSCDFKRDAKCAKDCIDCLEEKFGKCCACVDLCPAINNEADSSHVGDTSQSDQQFFEILTEGDDIHNRWHVMKPNSGLQIFHPDLGNIELAYRSSENNSSVISHDGNLNKLECTVAFINRYLSMTKCKRSCTTLGASFFRWFHEGCCECIGKYCLNYGIDKPHCLIPSD